MMMLIIFLITDISMVGIFAGVYGNIAKYREGMLMGVHIPKSELEHPEVKELLQLYKKRNRQFYLWNMLAGIAVCLLYLLFYFYYRMDTVVRRILPSYHPPCLSLSPESIRH